MADQILLYDMARKGGNNCWSPNVWKTRLVLNYKGLHYTTEWLTHPEIAPMLKELDIPPITIPNSSPYSLPTLRLPNGTYTMDSLAIASALENLYPSPSLHLTNNLHTQLAPILGKISLPLIPVFMPRIGRDVVPETAQAYFHEARSARFGMPLDRLQREKGGPQAWEAAKPGLEELKDFLAKQKRDEGPFVLGSEVCYADFVIAALMESFRRIGEDLFEGFVGEYEELRALHEACGRWMERDT